MKAPKMKKHLDTWKYDVKEVSDYIKYTKSLEKRIAKLEKKSKRVMII